MRFFLSILLISILAAAAEYILPWWTIAIVSMVVALIAGYGAGRSFVMGFLGIAIFWLIAILLRDLPNHHILSRKMAALFPLGGYASMFALVTIVVGGLIGGLAAMGGALLSKPARIK
jgi:hypothetical protein